MQYKIMNYGNLSNCDVNFVDAITYDYCSRFVNNHTTAVMIDRIDGEDTTLLIDFIWSAETYQSTHLSFFENILLIKSGEALKEISDLLSQTLKLNVLSDSGLYQVSKDVYSTLLNIPLSHIHLLPNDLYINIVMNLDKIL